MLKRAETDLFISRKPKSGNKILLELSLGQANHLEEIAPLVAIIRSCTHQMDSPTLEAGLP